MQIEIIKVEGPTQKSSARGKTYNQLEVVYKKDGKVEGKKLMDFTYPEVYSAMKAAQSGSCYEVESVKEGDYWQWKQVKAVSKDALSNTESTQTNGQTGQKSRGSSGYSSNRDYETAAERAWKQTVISRQACLNTAVETLKNGKALERAAVIALASEYELWVTRKDPIDAILEMKNDIPGDGE
jgi:hypothetical protein